MTLDTQKRLEYLSKEELLVKTRRLLAEADALSSRIAAVNEISVAINASLDLDTILRVVAKQAKWLMDFEHCSVCLNRSEVWETITLFGKPETCSIEHDAKDNVGYVIDKKYPRLISDGNDSKFLSAYQSQLILPLSASGQLLGTINFAAIEDNQYTQADMRIAYMLSVQISSALSNALIVTELNQTKAELEARVEDLDAYNHTIAHDLKSPLSSILLSAQILQRKFAPQLPERGQRAIYSIESSTKTMNEMIDRLLWLAKIRSFEVAMDTVDMRSLVPHVLKRFTSILEEENIKVVINQNLPSVLAIEPAVKEVIANLVSNAIKYIGADNLNPEIRICAVADDDMVRFEVRDNGIGIRPEDQQNLFEMFSRVEDITIEGTGLGLSIVNRIVSHMQGEVGVESTYGCGSTFWFTLRKATSDA